MLGHFLHNGLQIPDPRGGRPSGFILVRLCIDVGGRFHLLPEGADDLPELMKTWQTIPPDSSLLRVDPDCICGRDRGGAR